MRIAIKLVAAVIFIWALWHISRVQYDEYLKVNYKDMLAQYTEEQNYTKAMEIIDRMSSISGYDKELSTMPSEIDLDWDRSMVYREMGDSTMADSLFDSVMRRQRQLIDQALLWYNAMLYAEMWKLDQQEEIDTIVAIARKRVEVASKAFYPENKITLVTNDLLDVLKARGDTAEIQSVMANRFNDLMADIDPHAEMAYHQCSNMVNAVGVLKNYLSPAILGQCQQYLQDNCMDVEDQRLQDNITAVLDMKINEPEANPDSQIE